MGSAAVGADQEAAEHDFPADSPYLEQAARADEEAHANFAKLIEAHRWLHEVGNIAANALRRGSKAEGYRALLRVADRVTQAAAPYVACHKGCAHCCHIAVEITEYEARQIAKVSGRTPARVRNSLARQDEQIQKYFGVPCPFLKDSQCSIYAHRPMSCRTHVNLAASSFFCDTGIRPEWSFVPSLNLKGLLLAYGMLFHDEVAADVRDFFPDKPALTGGIK